MEDTSFSLAKFADVFYPAEARKLENNLDGFLKNNFNFENISAPRAIIVPHAGYIYSGDTAGKAYAILQNYKDEFDSVIIIGPSHHEFVDVPAFLNKDFKTPLGIIKKDDKIIQKFLADKLIEENELAFKQEHSIEVQLPFLQHIKSDFKVVSILTGPYNISPVEEIINQALKMPRTFLIISSDLSHFNSYEVAKEIDYKTLQNIKSCNIDELFPDDACGVVGIKSLLKIAKKHYLKPELISYCNSGDRSSNKQRVVGYASFAFFNS